MSYHVTSTCSNKGTVVFLSCRVLTVLLSCHVISYHIIYHPIISYRGNFALISTRPYLNENDLVVRNAADCIGLR